MNREIDEILKNDKGQTNTKKTQAKQRKNKLQTKKEIKDLHKKIITNKKNEETTHRKKGKKKSGEKRREKKK